MKITKTQKILIAFAIGVLLLANLTATEQEKKAGFSTTRLLIGVGLTALGLFVLPIGGMGIPVLMAGLIFLRYTYIKDIAIPLWGWAVGFIILFFWATKKR